MWRQIFPMVVGTAFRHSSVQYHTGNYLLPKNMFGLAAKNFGPCNHQEQCFLVLLGATLWRLVYSNRPYCVDSDIQTVDSQLCPNKTVTAENLHPPLSVSDSSHVVRM